MADPIKWGKHEKTPDFIYLSVDWLSEVPRNVLSIFFRISYESNSDSRGKKQNIGQKNLKGIKPIITQ